VSTYRLAPEWARQDAVILVWPHAKSDWNQQLEGIECTYCVLSGYLSRHQKLVLVAFDAAHIQHIQTSLASQNVNLDNIVFIDIQTNDTWVRDFGPVMVQSQRGYTLLDFKFDAWGIQYLHEDDNQFNQHFANKMNLEIQYENIDFVLEGGNLEINNKGVLLSSKTCINRKNSSMHIDVDELETHFANWFGCNEIIWIRNVSLEGDDTGGHIDTLARFCNDDTLLYTAVGHHSCANNSAIENLEKQLKNIKQMHPDIAELIPLPLPEPIFHEQQQLPACYTNFLISNNFVFVPVFNDKQDQLALKIIDDAFPAHDIVDIQCTSLIKQFGGIHCATMQIPAGLLK